MAAVRMRNKTHCLDLLHVAGEYPYRRGYFRLLVHSSGFVLQLKDLKQLVEEDM